MLKNLPKAELHLHLDGAISPSLIKELGQKNHIQVSKDIFTPDGQAFTWTDFSSFHRVFVESFKVVQSKEDYHLITYAHLKSLAEQNTLYAELIVSPEMGQANGMSYDQILAGLTSAIDSAREDFGIEARILMVFMRHYGPQAALETAKQIINERHPYVVGVNLVGDIKQYEVKAFAPAFEKIHTAGLNGSCHAGELEGGPEEIWQAIDYLGAKRISHGVRCIEDTKLVDELIKRNIVLEVCPTSNIALKMYPNYEIHPLAQLHDAGLKITLNTDDPAFFNTTLSQEYEIAKQYGHFTGADLLNSTKIGIEAGFMDDQLKNILLNKLFLLSK